MSESVSIARGVAGRRQPIGRVRDHWRPVHWLLIAAALPDGACLQPACLLASSCSDISRPAVSCSTQLASVGPVASCQVDCQRVIAAVDNQKVRETERERVCPNCRRSSLVTHHQSLTTTTTTTFLRSKLYDHSIHASLSCRPTYIWHNTECGMRNIHDTESAEYELN